MIGVSSRFRCCLQYQLTRPPMVLARVKDGTLYMPVGEKKQIC